MGKAALTFAEIFIVLGLIFLIQMVANFSIYEGDGEIPPPDFEILKIRQIPSNGNDADHIQYFRFSSSNLKKGLHLQIDKTGLWERDIHSYVDRIGQCQSRNSSHLLGVTTDWNIESARKAFTEKLYEKFGISMSIIKVSKAQDEYVFSWSPDDLPENASLSVAIEHCRLGVDDKSRTLDPAWGLKTSKLDYPHPLIIERMGFRETIDVTPPDISLVHIKELPFPRLGVLTGAQYAGLAFNQSIKNCNLSNVRTSAVRRHAVKEITVTLKN